MKNLLIVCFIGMSMSCGLIGAQNPDEETKKDLEFDKLVESANKNVSKNGEVQQKAAQKANEIVDKAADKITTLKSEVNQLKTQLNETKAKLDSANSIDDSKPFSIKGAGS
jgi:ABC-type transporter Mla subunit MlaD